jgi:lysophospholipase L1-like esterase
MTTSPCAVPPTAVGRSSGRGGRRLSTGAIVVATMLGLAACGGGGSSNPDPGAPVPPPPGPPSAPIPQAPVASNTCNAYPAATGSVQSGTLAGKASSPDNRTLSFSLVSQARSGTVQLGANGAFTYSRTSSARGDADSFVYKVTDTQGLSAQATAQVIYGTRRIMPLGDSITDGVVYYNSRDDVQPQASVRVGYRKVLRDRLAASGYAVDFVGSLSNGSGAGLADDDHEGHPGATQTELANGVFNWLNQNPADVVMMHIGTNDVASSTSAAPTANILSAVDSWTSNQANPPVRMLFSKIIGQTTGNNGAVDQFNANLQSLYNTSWADAAGTRPRFVVRLVDMRSRLNTTTDMSDPSIDTVGLHPSEEGYEKMANAWFDYLVQNQAIHKCP